MKNRFSRFVSIFWVAVMLTVGLAVLTIAPKGKLQSDTENRYLQEFPALSFESLSSGEFSEGFERFMSDKFFGRDSIILLASEIESGFSILDFDDLLEFGDGVEDTFVDENMPAEDETAPPEDTLTVEDSDAESPEDDRPEDSAEPGSFYGNLSIWAEKADGSRTNLYTASKSSVDMSAEIVNRFADTVPEGNVYYLSVLQAWHANKYIRSSDAYTGWNSNVEAYMQTKVRDNVKVLAITDILGEHVRSGEYVYFRTDTHWTPLGAYYAYADIISLQGIEPVPYEAYTFDSCENFLGAYYDIHKQASMKAEADRLDLIQPLVPVKYYLCTGKDSYREAPVINRDVGVQHAMYLGGNASGLSVLRSEAGTGRKVLLVKDSFGLIPSVYLTAHYDEVYLIDPRFFHADEVGYSAEEVISRFGIDDIIFFVSDINGHGKDFTTQYMNRLIRG